MATAFPAPVKPEVRTQAIPEARVMAPGAGRLAALDGMRFLAALAVVGFHYVGLIPTSFEKMWGESPDDLFTRTNKVFAFGRLGVDFFFIISGFVIAMSAWGRTPREFFISRVSRLYPMYWVAVLLTASVLYFQPLHGWNPDLHAVFANLTMLQKPLGVTAVDSVYWSLWPELCFYVMFSVVVWKGVTYRRVVLFCGIWMFVSVVARTVDLPVLTLVVNPVYAPFFIAGIAFHLMWRFRPTPMLWGIVGMSFLMASYYFTAPNIRLNEKSWGPGDGWLMLTLFVMFGLVGAVALGWTSRIRWKWLTTAGAMTFPLYLIHGHIGAVLIIHFRDKADPWVVFLSVVAFMVVAAYVFQRFVERPMARRMRVALTRGRFLSEPPRRFPS